MARKTLTQEYNYVLDWIIESCDARRPQNAFVERAVSAYQGDPSVNYYKRSMRSYADVIQRTDPNRATELKSYINEIPDKKSFVVNDAVESIVNSVMGGVDRFQFGPYDSDLSKDDSTMDLLASACKSWYNQVKFDSLIPQAIRGSSLMGASYFYIKQRNGKFEAILMDTAQMLMDPKRFKTSAERFRGFTQRESLKVIRDRLTKSEGGYSLASLNEASIYLEQLRQELNSVNEASPVDELLKSQLRKDIDLFYKPVTLSIAQHRSGENGYKSEPEYAYSGDEVELAYVWDMQNDRYFEIVNRRYIIVGKPNPLKRKISVDYWGRDGKQHKVGREVKLPHTIIEIPFLKTGWDRYAITPLFYALDDFDSLCSMESVLYHNLSIMAPMTFVGTSSDNEKVARAASIAGEMIDALPQTFKVLAKAHDISPVMTAIDRYEGRIKKLMKAYDPMQVQAMIGDRATAKEVIAMSGQVAQGLNSFIANMETAMAEVGEVFMKLYLIMNNEKYRFVHNGEYGELGVSDILGDWEIQARLTSSIKLEQEKNAQRATEMIQYVGQLEEIDKKQFFGTMIPIAMNGLVNRSSAELMVAKQYRIIPMVKDTRDDKQKQLDEIDNLDLSQYSPEELDQMIMQATQTSADPNAYFTEPTAEDAMGAMSQLANTPGAATTLTNASPDAAGQLANDPTGQGYSF